MSDADKPYNAVFTTYNEMNQPEGPGKPAEAFEVEAHLQSAEDAAAVIFPKLSYYNGRPFAVWKGADGKAVWAGELPLEDPNDALGPFNSAFDAIVAVVIG